jgi:hypothetical protein
VVVGQSNVSRNSAILRAFRWTADTSINYLGTVLANAGVNMTGITLDTDNGVSGNRQFIVGNETLSGKTRGYIVRYFDQEIVGLTTTSAVQSSVNDPGDPQRIICGVNGYLRTIY